jgi:hypothetical protein
MIITYRFRNFRGDALACHLRLGSAVRAESAKANNSQTKGNLKGNGAAAKMRIQTRNAKSIKC